MILLLSTSDTDLLSARGAAARTTGWRNPARLDLDDLPELLDGVDLVVVRILGGYRDWQDGLDALPASGLPGGGAGRRAGPGRRADGSCPPCPSASPPRRTPTSPHGGPANLAQLHRFLSDTVLLTGHGFEPPAACPVLGPAGAHGRGASRHGPTVAVLYYRAHHVAGNTAFVRRAVRRDRGRRRPAAAAVLRPRCASPEPELLDDAARAPTRWWSPCWPPAAPSRPPRRPAATTRPGTSARSRRWTCRSCRALCLTSSRGSLGGQRRRAVPAGRRPPRSPCRSSTAG